MHLYKKSAAAAVVAIAISSFGTTGAEAAIPKARCDYVGKDQATCYQVISTVPTGFKTLYTDALINTRNRYSATLECYVEESRTLEVSVTATVGVSVKAFVVASMDASVSATVSQSVTATRGSRVKTKVAAHKTIYCDRGTYTYRGTVKKTQMNWNYPGDVWVYKVSYFTATAPTSTTAWRFR